jgi:hypothetical protein
MMFAVLQNNRSMRPNDCKELLVRYANGFQIDSLR